MSPLLLYILWSVVYRLYVTVLLSDTEHYSGLAGPAGHLWYQFLDSFTRSRFRVGGAAFIATKVALDEGVFGPIHVLGFFAYATLAEGGTLQVQTPPL